MSRYTPLKDHLFSRLLSQLCSECSADRRKHVRLEGGGGTGSARGVAGKFPSENRSGYTVV